MNCRNCDSSNLWPFLDLGDQCLPRFPKTVEEKVPHARLRLVKCGSCGLVQLSDSVPRDELFREFWYQSGVSWTIRNDLKKIVDENVKGFKNGETVLDIGCNDGTLLSYVSEDLNRVGFEPAHNLAEMARKHGRIVEDYFSAKAFFRESFYKAKLVFAIAMFYDLEDPVAFCREVAKVLGAEGSFVVQQNYLGLMLQNTAYDNICHEHLTYFSLASLEPVLDKAGLEIYHVELNQINGGSFKTFIGHKGFRDVDYTVPLLEQAEKKQGLDGRKAYRDFAYKVRLNATALNGFLTSHSSIMIYGAGTRGATLLQFSTRFNKPNIRGAVDNNPEKWGRYYLDTGIPIMSRDAVLKNPPDYFLVLPYHLADEIIEKEKASFPQTKWIVPLPELRIV